MLPCCTSTESQYYYRCEILRPSANYGANFKPEFLMVGELGNEEKIFMITVIVTFWIRPSPHTGLGASANSVCFLEDSRFYTSTNNWAGDEIRDIVQTGLIEKCQNQVISMQTCWFIWENIIWQPSWFANNFKCENDLMQDHRYFYSLDKILPSDLLSGMSLTWRTATMKATQTTHLKKKQATPEVSFTGKEQNSIFRCWLMSCIWEITFKFTIWKRNLVPQIDCLFAPSDSLQHH